MELWIIGKYFIVSYGCLIQSYDLRVILHALYGRLVFFFILGKKKSKTRLLHYTYKWRNEIPPISSVQQPSHKAQSTSLHILILKPLLSYLTSTWKWQMEKKYTKNLYLTNTCQKTRSLATHTKPTALHAENSACTPFSQIQYLLACQPACLTCQSVELGRCRVSYRHSHRVCCVA